MPVTTVSCRRPRLLEAGYPRRFQGKLISGRCARTNSKVTQTNGAAVQAKVMLRCERRCTDQVKNPTRTPQAAAMSRSTLHPPAVDRPPWTLKTSAIQGTEVNTNRKAWTKPHAKAIQGRAPKTTTRSTPIQTKEYIAR